ncbi:hypothetical protein B0H10DRAFT_509754 [Mycena sp. CBHHK59/15]|nr:hypothetical protein B0H10DRAFT_509754 [Mycena sp. CBHHK59/15]
MKIPQELINIIINEIQLSGEREPFIIYRDESALLLETLRSCALVARAFVQPAQLRLFSAVGVDDDPPGSSAQFSAHLKACPHLASYVRHLHVLYSWLSYEPVAHILSSLPNLEELDIYPLSDKWQYYVWIGYPAHLLTSFLRAFSLPNLRRVSMALHIFTDAVELHSLLVNAVRLKVLGLRYIKFQNATLHVTAAISATPRVVLDSLELRDLDAEAVDSMMHSFTTIDITHLQSLELLDTPITALLRANAGTLQQIKVLSDSSESHVRHSSEPVDSDILAGDNKLRSIHLHATNSPALDTLIRLFGNLDNLKVLQTMMLAVSRNIRATDQPIWRNVDAALSRLGDTLKEVKVYVYKSKGQRGQQADNPLNSQEALKRWMTLLAERRILQIYSES